MREQVLKTIRRYQMIADGARVGVAVSGGADSVALLEVLRELGAARGWTLEVLHFDHCLRGVESDGDRAFVEALAAEHGLLCHTRRTDLRALNGNLEQTARRLRYAFLDEIRRERHLAAVATGHTASDQAETVLTRLLHGASAESLAAIRPVRDGWIIRPMIEVTRDEVRAWLTARGQRWREDASNAELRYDRNRVRSILLPLAAREFNPQVVQALSRYAAAMERDESYWNEEVTSLLEHSVAPAASGWVVDVHAARAAHPALQVRLWKRLCALAAGAPVRLEQTHLEALLQLTARRVGAGKQTLPGLLAWRSFGQILLCPSGALVRAAGETVLRVPGEAEMPSGSPGALPRLRAERVTCTGAAYNENEEVDRGRFGGTGSGARSGNGSGDAPGDGPMAELVLRGWRTGDRIRPQGRTAACKLHELFEEQRVPAWERLAWPVVLVRGRIVWTRRFGFDAELVGGGALRFTEVTTGTGMNSSTHPKRLIE